MVAIMSQREKVLARREFILNAVKAGGATVKKLAGELEVSRSTILVDIRANNKIHWQDDKLYYGERL
jgi:DeoR/GlpR family transcriptional regulator of sugar metabolism